MIELSFTFGLRYRSRRFAETHPNIIILINFRLEVNNYYYNAFAHEDLYCASFLSLIPLIVFLQNYSGVSRFSCWSLY